jgi:hypothetical protein
MIRNEMIVPEHVILVDLLLKSLEKKISYKHKVYEDRREPGITG